MSHFLGKSDCKCPEKYQAGPATQSLEPLIENQQSLDRDSRALNQEPHETAQLHAHEDLWAPSSRNSKEQDFSKVKDFCQFYFVGLYSVMACIYIASTISTISRAREIAVKMIVTISTLEYLLRVQCVLILSAGPSMSYLHSEKKNI